MTPPFLTSDLLTSAHGFFGRDGGVSQGVYQSLNGSPFSADDAGAVEENRRRIKSALGADDLVTARQTHSSRALFVREPLGSDSAPEADALITDIPGLAVAVLTADCIPILIEAPGMVAAVHAGWRGSLGGIIENAVALMTEHGAARSAMRAAMGPALQRDSFEVRQDLKAEVLSFFPNAESLFTPISSDQWRFDHSAFAAERLIAAGLDPERITALKHDTLTENDHFFSYRAQRRAGEEASGRNVSAIMLAAGG